MTPAEGCPLAAGGVMRRDTRRWSERTLHRGRLAGSSSATRGPAARAVRTRMPRAQQDFFLRTESAVDNSGFPHFRGCILIGCKSMSRAMHMSKADKAMF